MKTTNKSSKKTEDDNVRYKINTKYVENAEKSSSKVIKKPLKINKEIDEDTIRYKFPSVALVKQTTVNQTDGKPKQKSKNKIKVNFWSSKSKVNRLNNKNYIKEKTEKSNHRHTIATTLPDDGKSKTKVKVCKRVSFLPSPLFSDNHVPMVTVPDDLTIQLNEEEANDLGEDLNHSPPNGEDEFSNHSKNLRGAKRKIENKGNDNELEFFTKYVVQKLRKMETDQRIYSENLINTVLMLGQLGKLNGKSKIRDA